MTKGRLDARSVRFSQGATALVAGAAFLVDARILVPILAVLLTLPVLAGPRANPWGHVFRVMVVPAARLQPATKWKAPQPVRFANLVGAVFLAAATVLLYTATSSVAAAVAWALVLIVAGLALLAAVTGLCVGCEIYVIGARLTVSRSERSG